MGCHCTKHEELHDDQIDSVISETENSKLHSMSLIELYDKVEDEEDLHTPSIIDIQRIFREEFIKYN
jgi:hypothetical protein